MRGSALIAITFVALAAAVSAAAVHQDDCHEHAAVDTFAFDSVDELREFFHAADYSLEDWDAGNHSVPRYYLAHVPSRWRKDVARHLPVSLKKRYFFFVYAPLVLEANEDLRLVRERLAAPGDGGESGDTDESWLRQIAQHYRLDIPPDEPIGHDHVAELLHRVDEVPVSLALAQAAVESGWSTSRFADQGNALFGQWTWGDDGITPEAQRDQLGDYKIKAFATPEASIAAYMHNLNTHPSYADFRRERARARAAGELPTGHALAATLVSYSELGEEYVATLRSVIRVNRLAPADSAYLRAMDPVMLVPVGPGAE